MFSGRKPIFILLISLAEKRRLFNGGFDFPEFEKRERKNKRKAASVLKDKLGKEIFASLLREGPAARRDYACR
jgi:hypothetical protein